MEADGMGSQGSDAPQAGQRRRPLPSQQASEGPFTAVNLTVGGAGIVLVAIGQYAWSMGRRALGIGLVAIGGILVAGVLFHAARNGLAKPRKK
jgi:hypothetical protein